jgi:hypothetical protein
MAFQEGKCHKESRLGMKKQKAEQSGQVAHKVQRVTADYTVELGSCLHRGKQILLFL